MREMRGVPFSHDRKWSIKTPTCAGFMTDYNWEITGISEDLYALDPTIFHYGGNAYYVTGAYARERGYEVTEIPR